MLATIFSFAISILLVAGSTQIAQPMLSGAQLVMGVWFAIAGAINGWQQANRK